MLSVAFNIIGNKEIHALRRLYLMKACPVRTVQGMPFLFAPSSSRSSGLRNNRVPYCLNKTVLVDCYIGSLNLAAAIVAVCKE